LLLGPGDDAALWRPRAGFDTALTCDALVEGVHFDLKLISPWELGARTAAASLSDLAAMGAQPRAALLSLSLPARLARGAFFEAFNDGANAWLSAFGATMAGGDLCASPGPVFADLSLLGEVERGRALLRSGARPGDLLYCTGTLGDSAAGLAALRSPRRVAASARVWLAKRHLTPVPRVPAGRLLATRRWAHACIDISDGLSSEAWHLSRESGVLIEISAAAVPISAAARAAASAFRRDPLEWALGGGEDYELLFSSPPGLAAKIERELPRLTGVSATCVGRVRRGKGVLLVGSGRARRLPESGFDHFKG
jgi:thiamine-monophosphate kinase